MLFFCEWVAVRIIGLVVDVEDSWRSRAQSLGDFKKDVNLGVILVDGVAPGALGLLSVSLNWLWSCHLC